MTEELWVKEAFRKENELVEMRPSSSRGTHQKAHTLCTGAGHHCGCTKPGATLGLLIIGHSAANLSKLHRLCGS